MYGSRRIKKMSNGSTNVYIVCLYYFAKIWGLAPFSFRGNKFSRGSRSEKIYSIVFVLLTVPIFASTLTILPSSALTDVSEVSRLTENLIWYLGLFGVVIPVATFLSKEGIVVEIIETLITTQEILDRSRVRNEYRNKFKVLLIQTGLAIFGIMFLNCNSTIIYWYSQLDPWTLSITIISCLYGLALHLVIIMFVNVMSFAEDYLKELNKRLLSFCKPHCDLTLTEFGGSRIGHLQVPMTGHETKEIEVLLEIEFVYGKIHSAVEKIVELFSFPILAIIGYYFLNLLFCCFYIYTTYINLSILSATATYQIVGRIFWMMLQSLELFSIARASNSVQRTGKSTAIILHKVWLKNHPDKLMDEIQMLSLQLLQRPLIISAFGFFPLDYSYLYKIFCAVVAYFVIMVQLDSSKSESSATQLQQSTWNVTIPN